MIDEKQVVQQVLRLTKKLGITKKRLGEILNGDKKSHDYRIDTARADRFLKGQKKITLADINILSDFFEKPFEYFLMDNSQKFSNNDGNQTIIQNNRGGQISVKNGDEKLVKKILDLENGDKKMLTEILDKLGKKK